VAGWEARVTFPAEGIHFYVLYRVRPDRLCGLVVRVPGCRPRGPGFDSRLYPIYSVAVDLERGSLSLVSIKEELSEINK
jgi:hypothetical protein